MKEKFEKLRKDMLNMEKSSLFAAKLFESGAWFFRRYLKDENETLKIEVAEEAESESTSEKVEAYKSFYKFAEEKSDPKSNTVKFEGGEVVVKKDQAQEGRVDQSLNVPSFATCEEYLEMLNQHLAGKRFANELTTEKGSGVKIMFVGDYPKSDDANQSLPCFQGEQGELLSKMISAMKLAPEEVLKTLLVKQLPENDDFEVTDEIGNREVVNVFHEIAVTRPQVVVTLGAVATRFMLGKREKLSRIHGKFFSRRIKFADEQIVDFKLVPIFHPSFLIINPNMKRTTWNDLQGVMKFLGIL